MTVSWTRRRVLGGLAAPALIAAAPGDPEIRDQSFGRLADGSDVRRFTLTNRSGRQLQLITYGAAVTSLLMPDREGRLADVVLGLDDLEGYRIRSRNFGATIGRYAGRIAGGRFPLDGREVRLETGGGPHSMHGGPDGFARRNWSAEPDPSSEGPGVRLTLVSPDGDQGFPGELTLTLLYRLTHDDRLSLTFDARTNRPTILNPTHHGYFNLSGDPARGVLDHVLALEADAFTPYGPGKLVTGEFRPLDGGPLDFRQPKPLGRDIAVDDEQMRIGGGYDHAFVIRGEAGRLRAAAHLSDPGSGRRLSLWTTEPGVQLFTANAVDQIGRDGVRYPPHCGVCLEPQHFQDSPNRPEFPSTVLRPGETFRSHSEYRFSADA